VVRNDIVVDRHTTGYENKIHQVRECVSDCCLTPKLAIFQIYHGENKLQWMRRWWCPHCTRSTHL